MWDTFVELLRAAIVGAAHLCGGSLGAVPLLSGLFAAVRTGLGPKVRFLWVADLARPEGLLALGVTSLMAWAVSSTPPSGAPPGVSTALVIGTVGVTIVFLLSASSAVALSMGAGSLVSILQSWILARETRRRTATTDK